MRQGRFTSIGNTALSDHSDSFAKAPSSAERGRLSDLPSGRTATLPFRAITQEAQCKLVVLSGEREGLERALSGVVSVGADPSCDVVLAERGVSRRHAEFEVKAGGRVWVRDLGSRNGTFVQGTRVMEAELPLGAVVQLGETELGLFPRWRVREVEPSRLQRFGDPHLGDGPTQFIAPHGFGVDSQGNLFVGEVSYTVYGRGQQPPRSFRCFRKLQRV